VFASQHSHNQVWSAYYDRYGAAMRLHHIHQEQTMKKNLERQLADQKAFLEMQKEKEVQLLTYEQLLREQILVGLNIISVDKFRRGQIFAMPFKSKYYQPPKVVMYMKA
jgi:hypothetical protein